MQKMFCDEVSSCSLTEHREEEVVMLGKALGRLSAFSGKGRRDETTSSLFTAD